MSLAVFDALEATNEDRGPKRSPPISRYDVTSQQLSCKTDTKTDVIVAAPRGEESKSLRLKFNGRRTCTSFDIQRLIPGLNKSGTLFERPDHKNRNLNIPNPKKIHPEDKASCAWRLGTFVLVVDGPTKETRTVRNIYADEESWNARSLQTIHRPWSLPSALPLDEDGVPFKIVFPKRDLSAREAGGRAFEAGEPLLVLTSPGEDPDCMLPVVDFEGYRGEIFKLDVFYGVVGVPWGVRVNRDWWQRQIDLFNDEASRWANMHLVQRILVSPPSFIRSYSAPLLATQSGALDFSVKTQGQRKYSSPMQQKNRILRTTPENKILGAKVAKEIQNIKPANPSPSPNLYSSLNVTEMIEKKTRFSTENALAPTPLLCGHSSSTQAASMNSHNRDTKHQSSSRNINPEHESVMCDSQGGSSFSEIENLVDMSQILGNDDSDLLLDPPKLVAIAVNREGPEAATRHRLSETSNDREASLLNEHSPGSKSSTLGDLPAESALKPIILNPKYEIAAAAIDEAVPLEIDHSMSLNYFSALTSPHRFDLTGSIGGKKRGAAITEKNLMEAKHESSCDNISPPVTPKEASLRYMKRVRIQSGQEDSSKPVHQSSCEASTMESL